MKFFTTQFASFRQLQARAKALGLKANGTKIALRERIARYYREGVFGLLVRIQRPQHRRAIVKQLAKVAVPAFKWVGGLLAQAWANRKQIAAAAGGFLLNAICGVIAFVLAVIHVAVLSYERIEDTHAAPYELPQLVAGVIDEEYVAPAVQQAKEAAIASEPELALASDTPVLQVITQVVGVRVRRSVTRIAAQVEQELAPVVTLLARREVVIPALNV